jgi:hypothetical protein
MLAAITLYASAEYSVSILLKTGQTPPIIMSAYTEIAGPFIMQEKSSNNQINLRIWYIKPSRAKNILKYDSGLDITSVPEEPGDGLRHEFRLKNLSSGKTYTYMVPGLDSIKRSFTLPDKTNGIHIAYISDTGNTRKKSGYRSYFREVLSFMDQTYASLNTVPAFLINGGDIIKNGPDKIAWTAFFKDSQPFYSMHPVLHSVGNHDFIDDFGSRYRYFFNQPLYYSLDYDNIHILSINPYDGLTMNYAGPYISSGRKQFEFAENYLKKYSGDGWIIVLIHNPLMSSGDFGNSEVLLEQYHDMFEKYGVDIVMSGHDHNFECYQTESGTIYLISGTGGSHIDSYIMDRLRRRWLSWIHDRDTTYGLYQNDYYCLKFHRYGELSWGFTDIEINNDALTVSYYRWMDFQKFLDITDQKFDKWEMLDMKLPDSINKDHAMPIKKFYKKRKRN